MLRVCRFQGNDLRDGNRDGSIVFGDVENHVSHAMLLMRPRLVATILSKIVDDICVIKSMHTGRFCLGLEHTKLTYRSQGPDLGSLKNRVMGGPPMSFHSKNTGGPPVTPDIQRVHFRLTDVHGNVVREILA